jgi:hypothetical protein
VSEYQYYEFHAIDRPLTAEEMSQLRSISTRATITATSFVNTYQWGNLKADPVELLMKYFDAFVYVTNWGSHWLFFRVPTDAVDLDAISEYETQDDFTTWRGESHIVLGFCSEDEPDGWEDGDGWLASLISLRADILRGDYRAPYIAWLQDVYREIPDEDIPPVPPGMTDLSASLTNLAEFLRVDDDLLDAVAEDSAPLPGQTLESQQELMAWMQSLEETEKNEFLCRVADGDATVQWELQKLFRTHRTRTPTGPAADPGPRRSMDSIFASRDERIEQRRQEEARAREREKREQEAVRRAYLEGLAGREDSICSKISRLIGTVQQPSYDRAVKFLVDLRDAAVLRGNADAFGEYLSDLRNKHARKVSLIDRLDKAGL